MATSMASLFRQQNNLQKRLLTIQLTTQIAYQKAKLEETKKNDVQSQLDIIGLKIRLLKNNELGEPYHKYDIQADIKESEAQALRSKKTMYQIQQELKELLLSKKNSQTDSKTVSTNQNQPAESKGVVSDKVNLSPENDENIDNENPLFELAEQSLTSSVTTDETILVSDESQVEDVKSRIQTHQVQSPKRLLTININSALFDRHFISFIGQAGIQVRPHHLSNTKPAADTNVLFIVTQSESQPKPKVDLPSFAATVQKAADTCETGRFGEQRIFISHVWRKFQAEGNDFGLEETSFKQCLIEAHLAGHLKLSGVARFDNTDPSDVSESETTAGSKPFYFIRLTQPINDVAFHLKNYFEANTDDQKQTIKTLLTKAIRHDFLDQWPDDASLLGSAVLELDINSHRCAAVILTEQQGKKPFIVYCTVHTLGPYAEVINYGFDRRAYVRAKSAHDRAHKWLNAKEPS